MALFNPNSNFILLRKCRDGGKEGGDSDLFVCF